jgi:hypothetical protein
VKAVVGEHEIGNAVPERNVRDRGVHHVVERRLPERTPSVLPLPGGSCPGRASLGP